MIVLDASVALKLAIRETDSPTALALWQTWVDMGEEIVAPALFRPESLSVVRRNVHRGLISEDQGDAARQVLDGLAIDTREPPNLYSIAWDLARRFRQPTVYDCCYVALAAIVDCDFWTADRRLFNSVHAELAWVHLLGGN